MPRLSSQHYVRLYDYIDPDYEKILHILQNEMGWSTGGDTKVEHLDCRVHDVAGYVHHLKFPDLTPHTIHRSGLIRMGKVERGEALAQETKEHAENAPPDMLAPFCREIGITPGDFQAYAKDWKKLSRFREKKKNKLKSLYHMLTRQ